MKYTKPEYSKDEVDAAGQELAEKGVVGAAESGAIYVVQNWVASHQFPLNTLRRTLNNRAQGIAPDAVLSQRTKRVRTIAAKLARLKRLRLSGLQDIGGCRAIMPEAADARELVTTYIDRGAGHTHEFVRAADYVLEPKASGYRSYHLVYSFNTEASPAWKGHQIELQIRSQAQHNWATAVETIDAFLGFDLKSGSGPEDWKRFFALAGSALARREGKPLVPGCPQAVDEEAEELRALDAKLRALEQLDACHATLRYKQDFRDQGELFVILKNSETRRLTIKSFRLAEQDQANAYLSEMETEHGANPSIEVVQVRVASLEALHRAYPNYFSDSRAFREAIAEIISRKR